MVALPPQLPRIDSMEDRDLLHDFLALNQDLFALAEHSGRDLIELIAWTASPAIAPYIAQFRSLTADRLRWRALATLENILANPKNQTEERRAASTILRALTTPARAPAASSAPMPQPSEHSAPANRPRPLSQTSDPNPNAKPDPGPSSPSIQAPPASNTPVVPPYTNGHVPRAPRNESPVGAPPVTAAQPGAPNTT